MSAPTWSLNGRRLAVSLIYRASPEQPGSALAVLDTDGRDAPLMVWAAPPGEAALIAPGFPHYVNWSPDGEHLALLAATPAGMTLHVLDRRAEKPPLPVARGAPTFFSWSPRGDVLLVHHGPELSVIHMDAPGHSKTLLNSGIGCLLPAWSPSRERFAFARLHRGSQSLSVMTTDGSERAVATLPRASCALAWRPGHEDIAFSVHGSAGTGRGDGLWLVRIGSGEPVRLLSDEIGAFIWSPDGSSIAFLTPAPIPGQSHWCVLDIETGTVNCLAPFYGAPELTLMLTFFEQYSVSHRIWSANGGALALNGRVPANGTPPDVAGYSVYIQPLRREAHPIFVAAGTFASWRPV
jgi:Tol biopolymer transport system component